MRIRMSSYRDRKSDQDPNAKVVEIGPLTIWFSYLTPVAFLVSGKDLVIRKNVWSVATGKHLNAIDDDHGKRIPSKEFEQRIHEELSKFFFPRDLDPSCPMGVVADWLELRGLTEAAQAVRDAKPKFPCNVCGKDMGWDAPSGVCSQACLERGQAVRD